MSVPRIHTGARLALLGALIASADVAASARQTPPSTPATPTAIIAPDGVAVPVAPIRRGAVLPLPPPPPALPPGADAVEPQTVRLTVRASAAGGRARTARQTVSRTAARIHIALADGGEWLFERNAVDPRRTSAYAVVHASRVIVAYSDTDVRNLLGISGWAQVLTFGCRVLPATAAARPGSCAALDGRSHVTIDRVTPGVDPHLIAHPSQRFPQYREVDVADWLEDHER
jgi:hypothetical protein